MWFNPANQEEIILNDKIYTVVNSISSNSIIEILQVRLKADNNKLKADNKNFVIKRVHDQDYKDESENNIFLWERQAYSYLQRNSTYPTVNVMLEYDDDKQMMLFNIYDSDVRKMVNVGNINSVDLLLILLRDVILGLKFIHEQDMSHNDIRLANILYDADKNLYLIADFDLAGYENKLIFLSTATIAAPETLFNWRQPATLKQLQQADLYSLGVLLYNIYKSIKNNKIYDIYPYTESMYDKLLNFNNIREPDSLTITQDDIILLNDCDANDQTICNVINGLLQVDPEKRLTIAQVIDMIIEDYAKFKSVNTKLESKTNEDFFYNVHDYI